MAKSRKQLSDCIRRLESSKTRHAQMRGEFEYLGDLSSYDSIMTYYDELIAKYKKEKSKLPIGHRFNGIFYIKKPYSNPVEYEKIEGTIFMREDLSSWKIESGNAKEYHHYFRSVYKAADATEELKREDAAPVYKESA